MTLKETETCSNKKMTIGIDSYHEEIQNYRDCGKMIINRNVH